MDASTVHFSFSYHYPRPIAPSLMFSVVGTFDFVSSQIPDEDEIPAFLLKLNEILYVIVYDS